MTRSDEEIPYRSEVPQSMLPSEGTTRDEDQYDTLKSVYEALKASMDELDKWHAFDLESKELTLKQQIIAHRLAYEMVSPLLETVQNALAVVDDKYRNR